MSVDINRQRIEFECRKRHTWRQDITNDSVNNNAVILHCPECGRAWLVMRNVMPSILSPPPCSFEEFRNRYFRS